MNHPKSALPVAAFGELMLRLDCPPGKRLQHTNSFNMYFGGAEANVCVLLSQLGIPARFVTALPNNDIGQSAINSLREFGIDTAYIARQGSRTGIYFTEHGSGIRAGRVLYDRQNSAFSELRPGQLPWDEILNGCQMFYWSGIAASLSQTAADVCREALEAARAKGIRIAADMNYRSTLWKYGPKPSEIMPDLLSYCDTITGDVDTIEQYFGIKTYRDLIKSDQFGHCAEALKKELPNLKVLAMSFRETGAHFTPTYSGLLMLDNQVFQSPDYAIPKVTDRIGSGDAFQGGLLYGLLNGHDGQQTINFAAGCAILKHSMDGDFTILSAAEVDQFVQHGPQSRVIR